jgi:hypothetical protein
MEEFRFLLKDVTLSEREVFPEVDPVLYKGDGLMANERQFYLTVPDIADFYTEDGILVFLRLKEPLQKNTIELYLNGSVLGSLLHQRNILTLHGSSFRYKGKHIVICGHSGFGKSSLTLSMCLKRGAEFLTDDLTPIQNGNILPLSEHLKVWQDTLNEFGLSHQNMEEVWNGMEKYYFPMQPVMEMLKPDCILFGQIDSSRLEIEALTGADKFTYVLSYQYWEELSNSMQESRTQLFGQIADLCTNTAMYTFVRPLEISVESTTAHLVEFLTSVVE